MTRAEVAALKAYPTKIEELHYSDHIEMNGGLTEIDVNRFPRIYFQKGYEQAEKDLIASIRKQVQTWMPERDGDEHTEGERLAFRSVLHLLEELEDEK